MSELPSSQESIVRLFLTSALLRATLSMRVKAEILRRFAPGHEQRVSPLQWVRWWNKELLEILRLLLCDFEGWRPKTPAKELAMLFDPNIRHRRPI